MYVRIQKEGDGKQYEICSVSFDDPGRVSYPKRIVQSCLFWEDRMVLEAIPKHS